MNFQHFDLQQEDTIVGLSTPPEPSLRGIVRISGEKSLPLIQERMDCSDIQLSEQPTYSWLETELELRRTRQIRVPATIFLMKAPASYTCEDVIELHIPGSLGLADLVMNELLDDEVRMAEPGEFTERAFLNGRIDLTQAEAVLQCIQAETEEELSMATDQLQGVLAEKIQDLSNRLLNLCSYVEAALDFSDQDIEVINREQILSYLSPILDRVHQAVEQGNNQQTMKEDLKVSFSGAPNVGKSSLFNRLIREDRAIVTEVAGTTRDIIEGTLSFSGSSLKLLDTAGLGELDDATSDELREKIFEKTKNTLKQADLILHVTEAPELLSSPNGLEPPEYIPDDCSVLLICNKIDRLDSAGRQDLNEKINTIDLPVFSTSASKNQGIEDVRDALEEWTRKQGDLKARKVKLNRRHVDHLEQTREHLRRAREAVRQNRPQELIAADLRNALDELRSITGEGSVEDILDRIFGEFCIGK